jgi:integrase/recombinase XerD
LSKVKFNIISMEITQLPLRQSYKPSYSSERIADLVDSFVQDQDVKPNSKQLYRRTLSLYLGWTRARQYSLSNISRAEILEYKEYLLASGLSPLTVGSYITSVRRFYEWTEANKHYPNVAKGVKTPRRIQQFSKQPLIPSQAKALLSYYQGLDSRDYAIVTLLLKTGLRTIEISRANIEDIVYKGSQRVLLVHGKGRDSKDNFVLLTPKTYAPIAEYLSTRSNANPEEPLFTSTSNNSTGGRLSTRTISHIAKEGLRAIGLDDKAYTAHSLRHTGATNILLATGDLEQTRLFCRHTNPATTLIYTATLKEHRRLQNSGEAILDELY